MNADPTEYLLLFRNTDLESRLSQDDVTEAMRRLNDWIQRWTASGHFLAGQPLGAEGRVISTPSRLVVDGPFAEAKEVVGGYVIVRARDLEEATEIGRDWPMLDYGALLEVRPLIPRCPSLARVQDAIASGES